MRTKMTLPVALLCLFAAGCSGEPSRYAVQGSATIDGKPLALAHIVFVAVNPAVPTFSGASTTTDKDGNFTVKNTEKKQGLIAGECKVIFQQTLINGKPSFGGAHGKKSAMGPNETEGVPETYLTPDTTPITVTIAANMEPLKFELKK